MSASGFLPPGLILIWEACGLSEFQLWGSRLPGSSGQGGEAGGGPYHGDLLLPPDPAGHAVGEVLGRLRDELQ